MAQPTPLTLDLGSAVKIGLLAAGLGVASIAAFLNHHPGGGLFVGGLAVLFGYGASKMRRGTCPTCGARADANGRTVGCAQCDAFALVEADRLVPLSPDFIASSPWLAISTLRLRSAPDWKWPWANR